MDFTKSPKLYRLNTKNRVILYEGQNDASPPQRGYFRVAVSYNIRYTEIIGEERELPAFFYGKSPG
jgi:hypothetical protein